MRYVFVQEEYGYRHWVGMVPTDMTIEEITEWWEGMNSMRSLFFSPNDGFIVPLHEVDDVSDDEAEVATWSWTDDQGEKHILNRDTVIAFFHVHEDDDSYMKVVGGGHHYHLGYDVDEPDENAPTLEPPTPEMVEDWKENKPHIYELWKNTYGKHSSST